MGSHGSKGTKKEKGDARRPFRRGGNNCGKGKKVKKLRGIGGPKNRKKRR